MAKPRSVSPENAGSSPVVQPNFASRQLDGTEPSKLAFEGSNPSEATTFSRLFKREKTRNI